MIPQDVLLGILIELPVKTLLRFKSVSKEWCSTINHPYFINLHIQQCKKTNRHNLRILLSKTGEGGKLFSVDFDSVNFDDPRVLDCHPLKQYDDGDNDIKVVGSCNGLICLMKQRSKTTVLLNISTGDYRVLPYVPMELTAVEGVFNPSRIRKRRNPNVSFVPHVAGYLYGLGHDSINDDYKLVRVARMQVDSTEHKIGKPIVYSLRTNTWRRGEEIPYHFLINFNRPGIFVCGAIHWVTALNLNTVEESKFPNARSIIAFDVSAEKHSQLELLDNMGRNFLVLGAIGECLSATETTLLKINVWSMKDYGVKDSWTMLFSFRTYIPFHLMRHLAYSKTQDKVLLESYLKKLLWYDPKKDEFKYFDESKHIIFHSTDICMESLVQLWFTHEGFGSSLPCLTLPFP